MKIAKWIWEEFEWITAWIVRDITARVRLPLMVHDSSNNDDVKYNNSIVST